MKRSSLLKIFTLSITSIRNYTQLLLIKNSIIITYFIFWLVSLVLLQTLYVSFVKIPHYTAFLDQAFQEFSEYYPNDLQLDWDGTRLSATHETITLHYPSFIDPKMYQLPETLGTYAATEVIPQENASFNTTLLVVTPTMLFLKDAKTTWTEYQLPELLTSEDSFTLTKETVSYFYSLWRTQYSEITTTFQVLGGIGFWMYTLITVLLVVLIRAALLLLLFKISSFRSTFKAALKLSALFFIPTLAIETITIYLYGADTYGISDLVFWILVFLFITSRKVVVKRR